MKKHAKNFSKFTFVGVVFLLLAVLSNWLIIDVLEIPASWGSPITFGGLFILKYFAYRIIGLMKPAFFTYATSSISVTLLNIVVVWILVDYMGFPGGASTALVIGTLFILRYILFAKAKILHEK